MGQYACSSCIREKMILALLLCIFLHSAIDGVHIHNGTSLPAIFGVTLSLGASPIILTSFSLKLPFHHPSRACALHYESVLWSLRDYVEFDAHFPSHETRRPQEHCTV